MHTPDAPLSTMVYMDYENIQELLRQYGKTLMDLDFFAVLLDRFKQGDLKIVDFIIYGNFEKSGGAGGGAKFQTYLRNLGLQTRHSSTSGKNASDMELTVDALRNLYKASGIDLYIIITSDRDIIPLLKAIRLEGKLSCILSTRNGFNQVVANYADIHEFLEDIFGLTGLLPVEQKPVDPSLLFESKTLASADGKAFSDADGIVFSDAEVDRAKQIARLFYTSNIFRRSVQLNQPINLTGYTQAIAKAVGYRACDILESFKIAHSLEFITIYYGPNQKLYIKEGPKKGECV